MYFNNINYGSIESFAKHSAMQPQIVLSLYEQARGDQDRFEMLICDYLDISYSARTVFANGQTFKRKQDLADYIGITIQGVNKSLRLGKTLDEILLPIRSHQLRSRLKTVSNHNSVSITKDEANLLRGIHITKTDAESIKRVFNFDTYTEVYNFIKEQRARFRYNK